MTRLPIPDDRGSASLEMAILAPALLVVLGLALVAGRIVVAGGAVEQAASAAVREASLARTPTAARAAATQAADDSLRDQGVECARLTVAVDTAGFAVRVGNPAQVSATVTCAVELAEIGVPGMPGTRTLTAQMTSPLDTWRSR